MFSIIGLYEGGHDMNKNFKVLLSTVAIALSFTGATSIHATEASPFPPLGSSYADPFIGTYQDLFPDPAVRAAVLKAHNHPLHNESSGVSQGQLSTITTLEIGGQDPLDVFSFEGLQYLDNLQRLELKTLQGDLTSELEWLLPYLNKVEILIYEELSDVDALPEGYYSLPNLKTIKVAGSDTGAAHGLAILAQHNRVKSIDFIGNLTEDDLAPIASMTNLEEIFVVDSNLTKLPNLSALTKLQSLFLANNQFTEFPKGLEAMPDLINIDLQSSALTVITQEDIDSLQNADVDIYLFGNQIVNYPMANNVTYHLENNVLEVPEEPYNNPKSLTLIDATETPTLDHRDDFEVFEQDLLDYFELTIKNPFDPSYNETEPLFAHHIATVIGFEAEDGTIYTKDDLFDSDGSVSQVGSYRLIVSIEQPGSLSTNMLAQNRDLIVTLVEETYELTADQEITYYLNDNVPEAQFLQDIHAKLVKKGLNPLNRSLTTPEGIIDSDFETSVKFDSEGDYAVHLKAITTKSKTVEGPDIVVHVKSASKPEIPSNPSTPESPINPSTPKAPNQPKAPQRPLNMMQSQKDVATLPKTGVSTLNRSAGMTMAGIGLAILYFKKRNQK